MIALIPACFVGNLITTFSILWIVFGAALDPKAFRVFIAKLQMQQSSARVRTTQVREPLATSSRL